jgi:hypothetical protein
MLLSNEAGAESDAKDSRCLRDERKRMSDRKAGHDASSLCSLGSIAACFFVADVVMPSIVLDTKGAMG